MKVQNMCPPGPGVVGETIFVNHSVVWTVEGRHDGCWLKLL